jgi:hypothetical protein
MIKPKGGRGKKSPYETTHVRLPVPLKPLIEQIIEEFYEKGKVSDSGLMPLSESIEIARQVLNQKKSARISIEKLLTAIYQTEVKL